MSNRRTGPHPSTSAPLGLTLLLALLCLPAQPATAQAPTTQTSALPSAPSSSGRITGTVTDGSGALVRGARVLLSSTNATREAVTDSSGHFVFADLPASDFQLSVRSAGLADGSAAGSLRPGEALELPAIALRIAAASSDVSVSLTPIEMAQIDVEQEEHQRVLGILPNYYVVYDHTAPPLNFRQKVSLGLHEQLDPAPFVINALIAGIQTANDSIPGWGTDTAGYFQRYGALTANQASDTILRHTVFPVLFHQDPRYFYKGTGSVVSRIGYAIGTAFVCKGDNGRWQPAYASLAGNLTSGALSNLYYPAGNRQTGIVTVENGLIRTATVGGAHLVQEFLYKHISTGTHPGRRNPFKKSPPAPAAPEATSSPAPTPTAP